MPGWAHRASRQPPSLLPPLPPPPSPLPPAAIAAAVAHPAHERLRAGGRCFRLACRGPLLPQRLLPGLPRLLIARRAPRLELRPDVLDRPRLGGPAQAGRQRLKGKRGGWRVAHVGGACLKSWPAGLQPGPMPRRVLRGAARATGQPTIQVRASPAAHLCPDVAREDGGRGVGVCWQQRHFPPSDGVDERLHQLRSRVPGRVGGCWHHVVTACVLRMHNE